MKKNEMSIKRIYCKKHHGDWVTKNEYHIWYALCNDKASEWWDIEGAKEIYITLSNEPHAGAYKVRTASFSLRVSMMDIEAENGEGTHSYVIFPKLYDELRQFNPTCYMGIEIIEPKENKS